MPRSKVNQERETGRAGSSVGKGFNVKWDDQGQAHWGNVWTKNWRKQETKPYSYLGEENFRQKKQQQQGPSKPETFLFFGEKQGSWWIWSGMGEDSGKQGQR